MNPEISFGLGRTLYVPQKRAKRGNNKRRVFKESTVRLHPHLIRVLKLLCNGLPNKLIAYELGVTMPTIKTYLYRIFQILKVTNRTEAVLWVYKQKFGELEWEDEKED